MMNFMPQDAFSARYETYRQAVETYLDGLFTRKTPWSDLYESMRYSLLSGGKRIRPVLTLEFARLGGLEWSSALPLGCALELVHTFSLIHDDLPCMDNDDWRRGKPSNHKKYGETLAVLAGDALQTEAFRLILTAPGISTAARTECGRILAQSAGADGMGAGQVLDTLHAPRTYDELLQVHRLKTGAMIAGACELGAAAAMPDAAGEMIRKISSESDHISTVPDVSVSPEHSHVSPEHLPNAAETGNISLEHLRNAAETYGYALGMAFQIRDDALDVTADAEELGKPVGSDRENGKITFVDLFGVDGCARMVQDFTRQAVAAVEAYDKSGFLRQLAWNLAERNS